MGASGGWWWALGIGAVLVFWIIGAHNRLVALRNAVAEAWAQADEALRRRAEATEALVAEGRVPLAAEQGALDALLAAHTQSARAGGAMGGRPMLPDNARAWLDAETRLQAAAARVLALLEGAGEAARSEGIERAVAAWREAEQRLPFARQLFNDAAAAHDEALRIFPTSLVSRAFGFGPAGRL